MTFGPTPNGFVVKTIDQILAEIEDAERAELGAEINTSPAGVVGQINAIIANAIADVWTLAGAVSTALHIDNASGFVLRRLVALTGTVPKSATRSTVTARCNLNAGVTLPGGSVASVTGTGFRFASVSSVTNSAGVAADVDVLFEAEELGPIRANTGSLATIVSSVVGWNSIVNDEDAVEGDFAENDFSVRTRQRRELRSQGTGKFDSIVTALLAIPGVSNARVEINATNQTVNTIPPHGIRCVIYDGVSPTVDDNTIAQVIWDNVAAGVALGGSQSGTAVDILSTAHTVAFERAEVLNLWVRVDVRTDSTFPSDGFDLIRQTIADYGDEKFTLASTIYSSRISALALSVPGVIDVTFAGVGASSGAETSANFVAGALQVPDLDTGRITINRV